MVIFKIVIIECNTIKKSNTSKLLQFFPILRFFSYLTGHSTFSDNWWPFWICFNQICTS